MQETVHILNYTFGLPQSSLCDYMVNAAEGAKHWQRLSGMDRAEWKPEYQCANDLPFVAEYLTYE